MRVVLARAKCPRCGFIVVAASYDARDAACHDHDDAVHCDTAVSVPAVSVPSSSAAMKAAIVATGQPSF